MTCEEAITVSNNPASFEYNVVIDAINCIFREKYHRKADSYAARVSSDYILNSTLLDGPIDALSLELVKRYGHIYVCPNCYRNDPEWDNAPMVVCEEFGESVSPRGLICDGGAGV